MARGWESKSVEAQIESTGAEQSSSFVETLTPDQIQAIRERDSLLLSRKRIVLDLKTSHNPRYQKMLQDALAFLDGKLAELH